MRTKVITHVHLQHHGIKGMKWGVRRYQNKDGSLTEVGKRHVKDYDKLKELKKKQEDEGNKLIRSNSELSKDFGGKYSNVDDDEFFELMARDVYELNTDAFWNAKVLSDSFYKENSKSIETGRKIVEDNFKGSNKKAAIGTVLATAYVASYLIKKRGGK